MIIHIVGLNLLSCCSFSIGLIFLFFIFSSLSTLFDAEHFLIPFFFSSTLMSCASLFYPFVAVLGVQYVASAHHSLPLIILLHSTEYKVLKTVSVRFSCLILCALCHTFYSYSCSKPHNTWLSFFAFNSQLYFLSCLCISMFAFFVLFWVSWILFCPIREHGLCHGR